MREITDHEELVALCHADTLCLWAAQGLGWRSRAWRPAIQMYRHLGLRYQALAASAYPPNSR